MRKKKLKRLFLVSQNHIHPLPILWLGRSENKRILWYELLGLAWLMVLALACQPDWAALLYVDKFSPWSLKWGWVVLQQSRGPFGLNEIIVYELFSSFYLQYISIFDLLSLLVFVYRSLDSHSSTWNWAERELLQLFSP